MNRALVSPLAVLLAVSCGTLSEPPRPNVTLTAGQVFSGSMTGQTWTFKNGYGDTTTVEVQAPAQAEAQVAAVSGGPLTGDYLQPDDVVLHFTKDNCRAYWQPGACQAELWFALRAQPNGEWDSIASVINFPQPPPFAHFNWVSADIQPVPGMRPGYLIVPVSGSPQTVTASTAFLEYALTGVLTFDSLLASVPGQASWRTDAYVESVSTPVYSGPALVSEQWEGPCFPARSGCAHEKWYFAPGLGLVKIVPLDTGSGQDDTDPRLTILRSQ